MGTKVELRINDHVWSKELIIKGIAGMDECPSKEIERTVVEALLKEVIEEIYTDD